MNMMVGEEYDMGYIEVEGDKYLRKEGNDAYCGTEQEDYSAYNASEFLEHQRVSAPIDTGPSSTSYDKPTQF